MCKKIEGAIVIHGPGRSGTTLFNNILALHPELSWISGYVNRFPDYPVLTILNRLQEISAFERATRGRRYFPRTAEAYDYWDHYLEYVRNYDERQIENIDFEKVIRSLRAVMRYQGKRRLVIKLTGLARGKMLRQIFNDPTILYLDRDPRDVIVSYFGQRWLHKNDPMFEKMDRRILWKEYGDLFAKIQATKEELRAFRFKQLRYEDLVDDPIGFFEEVNDWCRLSHDARFYQLVRSWDIRKSSVARWKAFLKPEEVDLVNSLLLPFLQGLGYEVGKE